ncbi:adenosylcobinamide-phosphate synthase CbiB [Scopulibacillus cellulosilyticus]|uniref:Cobalamin biosynthesis protein CobD n=1 Tax=Scopulibacillus cellulosilyticus TaxID=2665665 RepID=A0ABW2PTJ8_9BACL
MINHLIAITIAYLIDWILGDPKWLPHPVRFFGKGIAFFDRHWNIGRHRKVKGLLTVILLLVIVFGLSLFIVILACWVNKWLGVAIEAILIWTTIAAKGLKEAAEQVYEPLQKGDLPQARKYLSWIVGRDTDHLPEEEIVRGTVETVAENVSDGVTAPIFWAFIGGAPFALIYRLINTCDSMLGYKSEKYLEFGFAAAKLDDLVNWLPSRITAILIIIVNKAVPPLTRWKSFAILKRDARKHPSPNSGWGEAAVASLLGIQLGGVNYYKGVISNRAKLGDPLFPLSTGHILDTVKMMKRTVLSFILVLWLIGGIIYAASSWI